MKVYIYKDEYYPFFGAVANTGLSERNYSEIPDELWDRYIKMMVEFCAVETELGKYCKE
jgi:hypothetical protein